MNSKDKNVLDIFKECIPLFTVLSDVGRQKIIMLLSKEKEGINVNSITERMVLSRPAVSHHLKTLKQAGIIDVKKKGKENYYFLTLKEPISLLKNLINSIEENCDIK